MKCQDDAALTFGIDRNMGNVAARWIFQIHIICQQRLDVFLTLDLGSLVFIVIMTGGNRTVDVKVFFDRKQGTHTSDNVLALLGGHIGTSKVKLWP